MEQLQGGQSETGRAVRQRRRRQRRSLLAARRHPLVQEEAVEGVDRAGRFRHLERLDQLRRVGRSVSTLHLLRTGAISCNSAVSAELSRGKVDNYHRAERNAERNLPAVQ